MISSPRYIGGILVYELLVNCECIGRDENGPICFHAYVS